MYSYFTQDFPFYFNNTTYNENTYAITKIGLAFLHAALKTG